eukprot:2880704-Rhodomonas_salina.1
MRRKVTPLRLAGHGAGTFEKSFKFHVGEAESKLQPQADNLVTKVASKRSKSSEKGANTVLSTPCRNSYPVVLVLLFDWHCHQCHKKSKARVGPLPEASASSGNCYPTGYPGITINTLGRNFHTVYTDPRVPGVPLLPIACKDDTRVRIQCCFHEIMTQFGFLWYLTIQWYKNKTKQNKIDQAAAGYREPVPGYPSTAGTRKSNVGPKISGLGRRAAQPGTVAVGGAQPDRRSNLNLKSDRFSLVSESA